MKFLTHQSTAVQIKIKESLAVELEVEAHTFFSQSLKVLITDVDLMLNGYEVTHLGLF
jgi:DNA-directed RNA polymerase subunit L